jgi:microcystin-dependent protein
MPYPPRYYRLHNFLRDQLNGLDLNPGKIDAELNSMQISVDQINSMLRGITTAAGLLRGQTQATAMSLVGHQSFTATSSQTVFTTTIAWDAAFTVSNVQVHAQGLRLAPTAYAVANSSGFLQVTLTTGRTAGDVVMIDAYAAGAGILTRLQDFSTPGNGADLVGIYDQGNLFAATNVEDAMAEVMAALNALVLDLGPIADYLRRDGTLAMTGPLDMDGNTIESLAPATANGQAVEFSQFNAYVAVWNALQDYFLKLDGSTPMQAALPMGNQRITALADADITAAGDQHAVNVRTVKLLLAQSGALPIGATIPFAGEILPTGWLLCDGTSYQQTAKATLFSVIGTAFNQGGDPAGTFRVPDMRGRFPIGVGTGSYPAPYLGAGAAPITRGLQGGNEGVALTFAQMPPHQHTIPYSDTGNSGGNGDNNYSGPTTNTIAGGNGAAHENRPPFTGLNYIIKES